MTCLPDSCHILQQSGTTLARTRHISLGLAQTPFWRDETSPRTMSTATITLILTERVQNVDIATLAVAVD